MSNSKLELVRLFPQKPHVVAYLKKENSCPAKKFVDKQKQKHEDTYIGLMVTLELLAENGDIRCIPKIKSVGEGVWQVSESKSALARLYGFTWKGKHIITHGTEKMRKASEQYKITRKKKKQWEKENP